MFPTMIKHVALLTVAANLAVGALSTAPNAIANKKQKRPAQSQPAVTPMDSVDKPVNSKTDRPIASDNPASVGTSTKEIWWKKPEWWTLLVTAMAAGIVGWQSWETRKSAEAARDSIRFQEIALAQWPDIEIIGLVLSRELGDSEKLTITMRWKVLNSTNLPFTIDGIEIHLAKAAEFWEISEIEEETTLPPGGGGLKNFYPFFVEVNLDEAETKTFLTDGLTITVQMKVYYTDAAGKSHERFFGDLYVCTKNSMEILEGQGKTPTKRVERDDSPSTIVSRPIEIVTYVDDGKGDSDQNPN